MGGFSLLCNRIETELKLPIHVSDQYSIDKASKEEIEIIKREHLDYIVNSSAHRRENPFELLELKDHTNRKLSSDYDLRGLSDDEENWHYWVLRIKRDHLKRPHDMLFSLIESELIPIYSYIWTDIDGKSNLNPFVRINGFKGYAANQIHDLGFTMKKVTIRETDINQLRLLINAIDQIDNEDPKLGFIFRNIDSYRSILRMPINDRLRLIGKFSIIESVLTSRSSINHQSITYQLKHKIKLLNNRFDERIRLSHWFKKLEESTSFTKIIGLLYTYRSNIVHGTEPDFKSELKLLESFVAADYCVDEICRKCLAQAIMEPNLISDLRNC